MEFDLVNFGWLITVIGGLTLITNIITEVIKKTLSGKANFPIQIVATVVALIITVVAYFTYISIAGVAVTWYMVVGSVVLGFFVSYAAQFGFDKLKEVIAKYAKG